MRLAAKLFYTVILFFSLITLAGILCHAQCPSAQQTTVTFTLTDSDTQLWFGAKVTANLYNPSQTQKPLCASTGQTFPIQVSATTNGSGAASMTLTGNTAISPSGTRWIFTIQPQASVPAIVTTQLLIQTGGTQNLTSTLDAQIIAPRFQGIAQNFGYNTTEVILPYPANAQFYNVTLQCQDYYNSSTATWNCGGAGAVTFQTNTTNNASQVLLDLDNGTNTTVVNTSGGHVQINASGGGFNPSTTAYIFASFSGLYDDNNALSSAVPVATWSCNGTVCTVITSSAHGLIAGSYVNMINATGWFSASETPGLGSFQVIPTGLTTTQFEFAYTTNTGSGAGGNIYDADYWGIYQTANQPFLKGHGTVYGVSSSLANLDTNFSSLINCTLGTPTYLIIEAGQNDLSSGTSTAAMQTLYEDVWTKAHTAGCIVIQGSLTAANYGGFPPAIWKTYIDLNQWFPQNAKSFTSTSTGAYWDRYIDYNATLFNRNVDTLGGDANAAYAFAQLTNQAFSAQSSSATTSPLMTQGGPSGQPGAQFAVNTINPWIFYDDDAANTGAAVPNIWMTWTGRREIQLTQESTTPALVINDDFTYGSRCHINWGGQFFTSTQTFQLCYTQQNPSSNQNYASLELYSSNPGTLDVQRWYADGHMQFTNLPSGGGTKPLGVDASGNVSVISSGFPIGASQVEGQVITSNICPTPMPNAAYSSCDTTFTWTTAFADSAYAVTCITGVPSALGETNLQIVLKTATQVTVRLQNGDASAANPITVSEIDCTAIHP